MVESLSLQIYKTIDSTWKLFIEAFAEIFKTVIFNEVFFIKKQFIRNRVLALLKIKKLLELQNILRIWKERLSLQKTSLL